MRASELCHRVLIQSNEPTRDENNYETPAWSDYRTLWAKVDFLSVKDAIQAKAAGSQTIARLKLRKRKDIHTGMRVLHRDQIFQITSPPMPDNTNGHIYMTFELAIVE